MPLVRIDVLEGRTAEQLEAIGDGVHRALVETIGIPTQDRFQIMTPHPHGHLIFDPQYLGINRTPGVAIIQVTLSVGRTLEQKRALYASIVRNLASAPGVSPGDVFINLIEVVKENWSFGNGVAQYAT